MAAANSAPADDESILFITRLERGDDWVYVASAAGLPIYELSDEVLTLAERNHLYAVESRVVVATTLDHLFIAALRVGANTYGLATLDEDGGHLNDKALIHIAWLAQSASQRNPLLSTLREGGEEPCVLTATSDGLLYDARSIAFYHPNEVNLDTAVPLTPMRLRAWHAGANR